MKKEKAPKASDRALSALIFIVLTLFRTVSNHRRKSVKIIS